MGDFTRERGAAAMQQLLEDDPDLDAVFAASDLMAADGLHTLRKAGRRVPDDVAMVGFDDIDAARFTDPPLTTVRQPIDDVAQTIVRIILTGVDDQAAPVIFPTELIPRDST